MHKLTLSPRSVARVVIAACLFAAFSPTPAAAGSTDEIVLYASNASRTGGAWSVVSDASAAGGARLQSADADAAKLSTALATPASYAELTFTAEAGKAYRLWLRAKAAGNYWANDSVFVQFSGALDASGAPIYRIGTTDAARVNLEDCSGCGLSAWGWQDNGWGTGVLGPLVYFAASGTHTLRIQVREDGLGIDQVVLSAVQHLDTAPGALKNDATILRATSGATSTASLDEIVLYASTASRTGSAWTVVADSGAAGGARLQSRDEGAAKVTTPLANPASYAELTFTADAGSAYRLWLRAKAADDYWGNDSVFVQFSGTVDAGGAPIYRIGTTVAARVNLEDCSGCGLSGWGWQDNGYGAGTLGPVIYFAVSGTQTLRIQVREDGLGIDQVVLSAVKYLDTAPGVLKNDATILPATNGDAGSPPPPGVTLVRGPYVQQVTASGAVVVWATREAGSGEVRFRTGASDANTAAATSTLYPASRTGLSHDYYQHEARLTGLSAATAYEYDILVNGVDPLSGSDRLTTAPARGRGTIRFIAFGDSGVGSTAQQQLAAVMNADDFDLALHGGDVVYGSADGFGNATHQTLDAWFFSIYANWLRSRPMFPSLGNHDSSSSNLHGRPYLDMFVLPANGTSAAYPNHAERYYSFDYGPVHFVALDTELAFQDTARRAEQLAWLERDLSDTTQPWKIAYFHRPPFSAGSHHGSDLAVRSAFAPIFERYGVQLVVSAHEHLYERSIPWRIGSAGQRVTYVVTGGGGGRLYPAGTAEWTAFSASRHHYIRVEVGGCVLKLEAVGTDGVPFDTASIDRCTTAPPPSSRPDVVLYAAAAPVVAGNWRVVADATAAAGARLQSTNFGAAKITTAFATPADYVELTFEAQAGTPYRLWMRGKADRNYWGNDSVHVQFDASVDASGGSIYGIGTTDAAVVNLEDCSGCGISGWGWQDNGWGSGVLGPVIYFAQSGTQRMRMQIREDGFGIDQIVLSPEQYLTSAPGALKNDGTILPKVP